MHRFVSDRNEIDGERSGTGVRFDRQKKKNDRMVFSMQRGRQTVFSPTVEVWDSSAVKQSKLFHKPSPQAMNSNISVTFTEAKGVKKKCLIIYDQRLVFSGGDVERLPEFALGVGGGSFAVNRETFRNRQGFVVLPAIRLISFEDSLR